MSKITAGGVTQKGLTDRQSNSMGEEGDFSSSLSKLSVYVEGDGLIVCLGRDSVKVPRRHLCYSSFISY